MADLGPEKALIFRVTHVKNVPWILEHGLHCQNAAKIDPHFVQIGLPDLIDKRRNRKVEIGPRGTLADYVPFYFTPFSIMMYNVKTGYGVTKHANSDIAVLVSSLPRLKKLELPFLFTDGHAYPIETEYFDSMKQIDKVDWPLLQSRNFSRNPEDPAKQTRYQAEALAYRHVPTAALLGIGCFDEAARSQIASAAAICGSEISIKISPKFYF